MLFLGLLEFALFLWLALRTRKDSDNIVDVILYIYLCQMFNHAMVGDLEWLNIFGISLYPSDCTVLLLIALLARNGKIAIPKKNVLVLLLIFVIMAVQSAARGVVKFGFTSEWFGDFRRYLYFDISVLYFWCVPLKQPLHSFEKKFERMFRCVTVYALVVMAFYFADSPLALYRDYDRPIYADWAIIYAAYIAYCFYRDLILSPQKTLSPWTLVYTATLIMNRYNTTWVALLAAVAVLLVLRGVTAKEKLPVTFYLQCAVLAAVALVLLGSSNAVMDNILSTAEKFDANEDNTFSDRIRVWRSLLTTVKGLPAVIGHPFGNGFYGNIDWQASPHNGYLEVLLRCGGIGALALVLMMGCTLWRAFRSRNSLAIMVCGVCMVYWVAYSLSLEQGLLIGLCMRWVYLGPSDDLPDARCLSGEAH